MANTTRPARSGVITDPGELALHHVNELAMCGHIHPTTSEDSCRDLTALYASGLLDHYRSSRGRVAYDILQALGWDLSEDVAKRREIIAVLDAD